MARLKKGQSHEPLLEKASRSSHLVGPWGRRYRRKLGHGRACLFKLMVAFCRGCGGRVSRVCHQAPAMSEPDTLPKRPLQSSRWRKLRRRFLLSNPVCAVCNRAPASQIHHEPSWRITGQPFQERFFVPVCAPCHRDLTAIQRHQERFNPHGKSHSTLAFLRSTRPDR